MFRSVNYSNKELITQLRKQGTIKSERVFETLLSIDRKFYVPQPPYYCDSPSSIGYGATISAPHMHAYALQYLEKNIVSAKNILDVGSGTGILVAAMALMAPKEAKVFGIEHVPELVDKSIVNIKNSHPDLLKDKVEIRVGDGRLGWPDENIKFDVIHVGAAPAKIPLKLLEQLNEGGVMVIPVGEENDIQKFLRVEKIDGQIKETFLHSVRYVPLTDLSYQTQR